MKRSSKPLLNRLLAGTESLSGVDKDEVLAQVLERSAPKRTWWVRPSFRIGVLVSATAALALMWGWSRQAQSEFTARGLETASFEMSCLPAECREGSKVIFKLNAPTPGYFSAFAQNSDGTAVWYFSNFDTRHLMEDGVLPQAPVLSAQTSGVIDVIGVFTSEPTSKNAIKERLTDSKLMVIRRKLNVAP